MRSRSNVTMQGFRGSEEDLLEALHNSVLSLYLGVQDRMSGVSPTFHVRRTLIEFGGLLVPAACSFSFRVALTASDLRLH